MATNARVVTALVAVQVFFGLHYLAAKFVLRQVPALAWATLRVAIGALLMLVLARALGRAIPRERGQLRRLAVAAVFGVVINQVCFIEGLARTSITHAAIINTGIPVGALLFAIVLGRERATVAHIASLALALGGVLLVLRPWAAPTGGATVTGDLLIVVNALSYALFLVMGKDALRGTDPWGATVVLLAFGTLGIAPLGAPALSTVAWPSLHASTLLAAAFVVLFATVGAYALNFYALSKADTSLVALFIYLQPLVAAATGVAVMGERPPVEVLAGGVLIFAGVWFRTK